MNFETLLAKIAATLDKLAIPYFITGGYAISVWGRPRATFDIDVVVELFRPQVDILARTLKKQLGKTAYIDSKMMHSALMHRGEFNIIHAPSGIKVDFFIAGDQSDRQKLARAKLCVIKKQKIYFISPEDLILSKLRWHKRGGGDYHLEDARSVIQRSKELLDTSYLWQEAEKQGVAALLKALINSTQ